MPVVAKAFRDKITGEVFYPYDIYIEEPLKYDEERINELTELGFLYPKSEEQTNADELAVLVWPKHIGGSSFELSNGEKVSGKKAAEDAQAALDAQIAKADE